MKTIILPLVILSTLLFIFDTANGSMFIETKVISGTVTDIQTDSITLGKDQTFLIKSNTPSHSVGDIITIRYTTQANGTLVYIESAKGVDSLISPKQKPQTHQQTNKDLL